MKLIASCISLIFLLIFITFVSGKAYAQTCTGSYTGGNITQVCTLSNGSGCTSGDPGCTCTSQCVDDGILRPCSNFDGNQSACLACHGAMGTCCGVVTCGWNAGAPTSTTDPCGGGPLSFYSSNASCPNPLSVC